MDRLSKVKKFIQETYYDEWTGYYTIQLFDSRNTVGDIMETVYEEDGITIDFCPRHYYLEVFGLTNEEYLELIDPNKLHSKVKIFKEGIDY
jgi:phosphorylcholine metabolism protein LicD